MDDLALRRRTRTHEVAIHEAGHAVAGIVCGLGLKWVHIRERGNVKGRTKMKKVYLSGKGAEVAKPHLIQGFAGPWAEFKVNPTYGRYNGGGSDEEQVGRMAVDAICGRTKTESDTEITADERMRAIALLEAARAAARQLVDDYWQAIEQVAAELEEGEKLSGGEVAMIVNFGRA